MSALKMCLVVAGMVLLLFLLLPESRVVPSATPRDEQFTGGRFFNFDKGATFAEMLTEPAHNIYGSSITLWVYRREGPETREGEVAELLLTGHAASKVCMRGSIAVYEAAVALPAQESDLLAAGAAYFQGITPEQREEVEKAQSVQQYKKIKTTLEELISQRDDLSYILSNISTVVLFEDSMLILALAYGDDTPLRRKICLLQGFVWGKSSLECDQLLKQASVAIEEVHHAFAHLSRLIGRFPELRTLMADYLSKLDSFLQTWQEDPWVIILDPESFTAELEEARQAIEDWFVDTLASLTKEANGLASNIDRLTREEPVREYLRSQSLDDLVNAFKHLEAETGLVTIEQLDHKILTDARAMIEQWLQYATSTGSLDEPLVIWYQPSQGQEGAVLLPFYYITSPGYLVVKLGQGDLAVPDEVLQTHQQALVGQVKADALKKKEFCESKLTELRTLRDKLQKALWENPFKEIEIYCQINFETLQEECQREPLELVTVKEYLINPRYLPGLIETAERLLEEANILLSQIGEATKSQGRLNQINYGVVLDSFLRNWDLAFISREQSSAYDTWREERRDRIWARIDAELRSRGIDPNVLKQENVLFDVEIEGDLIRVVPYFIADLSNLVFVIDPKKGIVEYIHPWGRRDKVKLDLDRMPQQVKALLGRGEELEREAGEALDKGQCEQANRAFQKAIEKYQEARGLLAQPLIQQTRKALEQGESQVAVETLKRALVIDPRGTSQWLIAEWRSRQVGTADQLGKIQGECAKGSEEPPDYCSFLNGKELFGEGRYFEALGEYRKALDAGLALNELYQGLIDAFWELGMYKRALETALLQLDDALQGLRIKGKPLGIANNRLQFPLKSGLRYENADLKTMQVEAQEKNLVVKVDQQVVLKVTSSRADDIVHLAEWLKTLDPEQISNIGDTVAERLLNTEITLFPAEEEFAKLFLSANGWGPLGQQLLKAMVYGGVKPSFIADSAVEGYLYPDVCSVEGKAGENALLPLAQVVSQFGTLLGTRDYLYDTFWSSSEIVEAIEYPDTREKIRDEVISQIPGQLIAGNADGLAAALEILQGSLGQQLSSDVRLGLLADARALNKLGARMFFTDYPQIMMLNVDVQGNPVYLLVLGEGSATEISQVEMKGQDLMELLDKLRAIVDKDPTIPARSLIQGLSDEEKELIRDKLVRPLVEHLHPRTEGDRIVLDLRGKDFALLDLPNDPMLRTILPYFLRGNRLVYIAGSSTARDVEEALRVVIDPSKLKLFIARPSHAFYPGWADKVAALAEKAKRIGVEVVDLTGKNPEEAKKVLRSALAEEDSLVFAFGDIGGSKDLDLGGGEESRFTQDEVPEFESPVSRFLAFVGCKSYAIGWSDIVISKNAGEISFGFWEEFIADELFEFLNRLVDRLGEDPTSRPSALQFLLKIAEELGIPGEVIVELPVDSVKEG